MLRQCDLVGSAIGHSAMDAERVGGAIEIGSGGSRICWEACRDRVEAYGSLEMLPKVRESDCVSGCLWE